MHISVITPCHNAAPWIAEALQSVAAQTYPAHEIIVIDDGSTDGTAGEIRKTGIPIKLLHVNYGNAAASRNAGLETATGDWAALLDADDVWLPNHLARAVELLRGSKDVAFMSNHEWIGVKSEIIPMSEAFQCKLAAPATGLGVEDYYRLMQEGFHFGHSTVVYRLDRLRQVGLFDPAQKRRHDVDLWLRMIAGQTFAYDTVKSVKYRETTPDSISKNELECDYYYLKALIKNLDLIKTPLHREHLARQARRAMGIAFADASAEHYARIRRLAWPHLPLFYKFFYAVGAACPWALRGAMKAKRRLNQRNIAPSGSQAAADQL
jgi:glycosyltransferase involved in cell wall biosynthesis